MVFVSVLLDVVTVVRVVVTVFSLVTAGAVVTAVLVVVTLLPVILQLLGGALDHDLLVASLPLADGVVARVFSTPGGGKGHGPSGLVPPPSPNIPPTLVVVELAVAAGVVVAAVVAVGVVVPAGAVVAVGVEAPPVALEADLKVAVVHVVVHQVLELRVG